VGSKSQSYIHNDDYDDDDDDTRENYGAEMESHGHDEK